MERKVRRGKGGNTIDKYTSMELVNSFREELSILLRQKA